MLGLVSLEDEETPGACDQEMTIDAPVGEKSSASQGERPQEKPNMHTP